MLIPTFYQEIQKRIDRIGFTGHHDIVSAPLSPADDYHAPVPVHGESDWYQNFMFVGEDRLQRYADFVDMDTHPLTASALDIYGEESTQKDPWGNVVQIVTPDQVVKDELTNLLFRRLNINHTLYQTVRETCKYGDKFQYLVMQKDKRGILFLKDMPVHSIWRLEWNGKLIAFVQQTPQGITPPLDPFSVVHWRISLNQEKYKPYGTSIFDPCRRHYRQMKLMEDAMVVYRITRAPERRVFFINCGRLNPAKAESYMRKIIHRFRKRSIINPSTGEIDWRCCKWSTRIPLLNGTLPTIKELAEQFPNGGFYVYSTNENGKVIPGKAIGAKKTGENKQLYKVTLDDGSSFEATENHPLKLMTGEYVCLCDAKLGMQLMAMDNDKNIIGRSVDSIEKTTCEDVYDIQVENYHNFALECENSPKDCPSSVFVHNSNPLCLRGDTEIPLLDGRTLTLKEIVKEFEEGKQHWTYSADLKQGGKMVPGKVVWAGKTRENAQLVRVHLDNGDHVDCTPDHKFPLRNCTKKEAKDLLPGDSLIPFKRFKDVIRRTAKKSQTPTLYERVFDPKTETWKFTHQLVIKELGEYDIKSGNVIHHINFNSLDNSPENLTVMKLSEHAKYHTKLGRSSIIAYNKSDAKRKRTTELNRLYNTKQHIIDYNNSPQHEADNAIRSEALKKTWREKGDQIKEKCILKFDDIVWNFLKQLVEENPKITREQVLDKLNSEMRQHLLVVNPSYRWAHHDKILSRRIFEERLNEQGMNGLTEFKKAAFHNHKVVSVEWLEVCEDTYTLTIEKTHTYALKSIVILNSPDEDFYVPVRDGTDGTRIEQLAGAQNLSEVDDVAWFKDQVLAYLKIPRVYLQDKEGGSSERRENLCLDGDTKIALMDGTSPTIKELAKRGGDFWTYSIDKTGKMVPGHGHDARITRRNAEVLEVELDNGEKVIATPDHPFMMRDGTYQKAEKLIPGDSLMPLYRRISGVDDNSLLKGYERVYNPKSGKWPFTHRMVQESLFGSIPKDCVVHHCDFNKRNNDPSNLKIINAQEHSDFHIKLATENLTPDVIARRNESIRRFYQTDEGKKKIELVRQAGSENQKKWLNSDEHREFKRILRTERYVPGDAFYDFQHSERNQKQGKIRGEANVESGVFAHAVECARKKNTDWTATYEFLTEIANDYRCRTVKDLMQWTGWSQSKIKRVLRDSGKTYREFFFEILLPNRNGNVPAGHLKLTMNHKVVAVRRLEGTHDTYCMTVDEHHNFALSAGIIVKNSMQDIRFARTVERVQSQVLEGLTKICIVHLMLRGYARQRTMNFQIQATCPSYAHEKAEQEVETGRIALADQYINAGFPRGYVWERVLKLTTREGRKLLRLRRKEDLVLAEREAQVEAYRSKANEYYTGIYAEKFGLVDQEEPQIGTGEPEPKEPNQGPEDDQKGDKEKKELPPDASAAEKQDAKNADKGWGDQAKAGASFYTKPGEPYGFSGQRNQPGGAAKAPETAQLIQKTHSGDSIPGPQPKTKKEDEEDPVWSDGEPEIIMDKPDKARLSQSPSSRMKQFYAKRKTKEQLEEDMLLIREAVLGDEGEEIWEEVLGDASNISDASSGDDTYIKEDTIRRPRGVVSNCHVGLLAYGELLPLSVDGGLNVITGKSNGNEEIQGNRQVEAYKRLQASQRTEFLLIGSSNKGDDLNGSDNNEPTV